MNIAYRADRRDFNMLNALLGLYLSIYTSCCCRCKERIRIRLRTSRKSSSIPAAAAGSLDGFLSPDPGLNGVFTAMGLRLRLASGCLVAGDLERLSNRDRFTSGSVWSNLERFELLGSVSAMLEDDCSLMELGVVCRDVLRQETEWRNLVDSSISRNHLNFRPNGETSAKLCIYLF